MLDPDLPAPDNSYSSFPATRHIIVRYMTDKEKLVLSNEPCHASDPYMREIKGRVSQKRNMPKCRNRKRERVRNRKAPYMMFAIKSENTPKSAIYESAKAVPVMKRAADTTTRSACKLREKANHRDGPRHTPTFRI